MKNKNSSWLASAAIILLLVVAGPAKAFSLLLEVNNKSPIRGQTITFTAEINIKAGEHLPIDYLTLTLSGPENQICEFYPDGRKKQNCKGITIERISSSNYKYGYGYGYWQDQFYKFGYNGDYGYGYLSSSSDKLIYKITLDTTDYLAGNYGSSLKIKIKSNEFTRPGPQITITDNNAQSNRKRSSECSTNWTCTEWSACQANYQYRNCTLADSQCPNYPEKPSTAQICNIQTLSGRNTFQNLPEIPQPPQPTQEQQQDKKPSEKLARITGAVIGPFGVTLADAFLSITAMVIVIGGLSTILFIRKTSLKRKIAYYNGKFN